MFVLSNTGMEGDQMETSVRSWRAAGLAGHRLSRPLGVGAWPTSEICFLPWVPEGGAHPPFTSSLKAHSISHLLSWVQLTVVTLTHDSLRNGWTSGYDKLRVTRGPLPVAHITRFQLNPQTPATPRLLRGRTTPLKRQSSSSEAVRVCLPLRTMLGAGISRLRR